MSGKRWLPAGAAALVAVVVVVIVAITLPAAAIVNAPGTEEKMCCWRYNSTFVSFPDSETIVFQIFEDSIQVTLV
jgi:hypothetical protein